MAGGTEADLATLDRLAARLRQAGDTLDAVGNGAPGVPDAGDVAAMMGAVLAHLSESAGNVVVGLREAGDRVEQSRRGYAEQDAGAAQSLQGLF
jgi:hypothetical protein